MALETFARQSLAQFIIIYGEIFDDKAIKPSDLEHLMWGRMCAKEANINKLGFKVPYDNIRRSKVTLPYLPDDINYTGCPVIKKNGGLYTPCCGKIAEDAFYCKSCSVDKEGNAKDLEFGTTDTRDAGVEDELFAPITFGEWMKGHKMTLTEVYAKLAAAGVQIEIPADQLICRELPKRRKGRPAKSEDSVVDEDTVKPKRKAKKADSDSEEKPKKASKKAASESETEKPKKKTKVPEPESESESEEEAPPPKKTSKPSPKASPAPSESESEKPKKKPSPRASPAPSESESEKPKKKASPKVSPAASESETEKPKKKTKVPEPEPESESEEEAPPPKKTEKPKAKAEKPAKEKAEKPKKEKAEKPAKEPKTKAEKPAKEPKTKAEKPAKEAKAEKPKKAKAESDDEDEMPSKPTKAFKAFKATVPEINIEELAAGFEEDEENEDVEATIDDVDYIIRNNKFVCSMEDGTILGTVDGDEVVWNSDKR